MPLVAPAFSGFFCQLGNSKLWEESLARGWGPSNLPALCPKSEADVHSLVAASKTSRASSSGVQSILLAFANFHLVSPP